MRIISKKLIAEIKGVEAQCREEKRLLTAKALVKWAKDNTDSSCYKRIFSDTDADAAYKWRESVARQLITYYVEDKTEPARLVRCYLSVPSDRTTSAGYRPYREVLRKVKLRDSCREEIFNKLQGQRSASSWDRELDPFFDELDELCDAWRDKLGLQPMKRPEEVVA